MQKIENIEKQIVDFQAQVDGLASRRNEAEQNLEDARRGYAKGIVDAESDEENILHRESLTRLSIEFDAMRAAVDLVKSDLRKAENEKEIVLLYQTQGSRHNDQMAIIEKSVSTINAGLPKLESLVSELTTSIKKAFSGVEIACSSLNGMESDLDTSLSLESFLAGDLQPSGDEDRGSLLDNIGEDIRDSVSSLDVPESIDLDGLRDLLEQMEKWQAVISSFQEGAALIQNRKKLYGKVSKKPSTQKISIPLIPHSNPVERPLKPAPQFDKNFPRGRQRISA